MSSSAELTLLVEFHLICLPQVFKTETNLGGILPPKVDLAKLGIIIPRVACNKQLLE